MDDMPAGHRRKIYGRRKGHPLRARQRQLVEDLLPALKPDLTAPADPGALFPGLDNVWLEIGFGGGEHLAWQAEQNPGTGIIGCEPFVNGVATLLGEIDARGLNNVRIHDDDARDLLDWLPGKSIDRAFILFPDPWPKARHHKRRLVTGDTLDALARILTPGAELRIATDWPDYLDWILRRATAHPAFIWTAREPDDWRTRPQDWPATRYEQKAVGAGRTPAYLRFIRRETP